MVWILDIYGGVCGADHWIFAQGYESFLQKHKTPEEKEMQRLKIEELRRRAESASCEHCCSK